MTKDKYIWWYMICGNGMWCRGKRDGERERERKRERERGRIIMRRGRRTISTIAIDTVRERDK